ncbi:cadherin-87A-like [Watersipora subatra]|uniref:cadherin-87A-like n=1 Tax=Watersipora subatra TaxID=2589382 RepID=UPI00355BF4C6
MELLGLAFTLIILQGVLSQNSPPQASFVQLYGTDNHIREDTPPGTAIYNVTLSDPDSPLSALTMRIDSNTFKFRSVIDNEIILFKSLNFEASTTASFVLTVSDGESDTPYVIDVAIDDVNDVQPRFTQLRYQKHIPESAPVGSVVFSDVTVNDQDVTNDELQVVCTYNSAFPQACNIFYVNTSVSTNTEWRGNVYLQQPLDYETMQEAYQLHLTAMDGNANNDFLMNFEILIDDVTDAPPYFTASFDTRVLEDVPQGTYVLTVEAVDGDEKDQRPIRYAFVSNPGSWFNIDPVTGNITTARTLDRNSPLLGPQGTVTLNITAQELLSNGQLGTDPATQSFTLVVITIIDVNNHPPSFAQSHYSVRMPEDLQNGQAVPNLTMHVSDADGMDNAYFKFVFSGLQEYEDVFRVSPPEAQGSATATLVIVNSSALDYDYGPRQYTLEVIAREVRTNANLSSSAIVTIYLDDSNDNKPTFDVSAYNLPYVSELTRPDNNGTGHETRLPLFITILDENDNSPEFTLDIYEYRVQELTTQLRTNQPIKATDEDSSRNGNNRIRYSLVTDRLNLFAIDPITATLSATRPMHFEDGGANGRIQIIVGAGNLLDGADQVDFTRNVTVNILIEDVNNNAPIFPTNYTASILENIRPGTQIVVVKAEDADHGLNAAVTYSIVSGDDSDTFEINADTGVISRRSGSVLDYDITSRYSLTVRATDKGNPRLSGDVYVIIEVIDNNDRNPVFNPPSTFVNVSEDAAVGFVVVSMKAIDLDINALLHYSFIEPIEAYDTYYRLISLDAYNYTDLFRIHPSSGQVFVNAKLDINVVKRIVYTVQAIDTAASGPVQSGTGRLQIEILNANTHSPVFRDLDKVNKVHEELPAGSVVMVLSAEDDDRDLVYYEIVDQNVSGALSVHPITGLVTVAGRIDYEVVQTLRFTAEARDRRTNGRLAHTVRQEFTVDVVNINDNQPKFNQDYYQVELLENITSRQSVVNVVATDLDLPPYGLVWYQLPADVVLFEVDALSGAIYKRDGVVLDRETLEVQQLSVIAFDGPGSPSRSTTVPVHIYIKDVNDNSPYFMETDIYRTLPYDVPVGSSVVNVYAFDADVDDSITYSISSADCHLEACFSSYYEVTASGEVYTIRNLTFAPDHMITVVAMDEAGHYATVRIHVTIIGNSYAPEWIFPAYNGDKIVICENQLIGIVINPDTPVSARGAVSYSFLINGEKTDDLAGTFRLISTSGSILSKGPLDWEQTANYLVQVQAEADDGFTSQRYLQIEICDLNDNDPEFPIYSNGSIKDYNFEIMSGVVDCVRDPRRNNACGRVIATDFDSPPHALIMYNITGGNREDFIIDPDTGVISSTRELNSTIQSLHYLEVTAYNYRFEGGGRVVLPNNSDRRTTSVYISVLSSAGTPTLIKDRLNLYAAIDTQIGTCLESVRPAGLRANVEYSMQRERLYNGKEKVSEKDGNVRYSVESESGRICTVRLFNPNIIGFHYRLQVNAEAGGNFADGTVYVWVTSNLHKIRIVVNGPVEYVNANREEILNALYSIFGTNILWIDSVGHYTTKDGSIDISRSDVIVYAVNKTSLYLLERNINTITYINTRINGSHRSIALSAKILRAEDITTKYIYLQGEAEPQTTTVFPIGLLIAMLLLLPLLLLPFLLCCCLCCPCCTSCFGGGGGGAKGRKYLVIGEGESSGGYHEESFIDDWYEQSKLYNNPAYISDWDSGSVHMLIGLDKAHGGKGAAGVAGAGTGQEITEETEEYYQQDVSGGRTAAQGVTEAVHGKERGEASGEWIAAGSSQIDGNLKSQSAVIVDSLATEVSAEGETVVLEERREQHSSEDNQAMREKMQPLLTTGVGDLQMSSLSPATIDMLDSASVYNAKISSAGHKYGHRQHGDSFSHTATVPRYGNRYHTDSDDYVTSQSYESDYHSSREQWPPSRSRHEEEAGMTIVLDAQPRAGMQADNVEYEVLTTNSTDNRSRRRSGQSSYSTRGSASRAGTLPRNGFTIELDPSTHAGAGMVADKEEYVITDDEGLSSEFFNNAPRSPKQRRHYKKTTLTRTLTDRSDDERY